MKRTNHAIATDYAERLIAKKIAIKRRFDPEKMGDAIALRAVEFMKSAQSLQATRFENFQSMQEPRERYSKTIMIEATSSSICMGATIPWFVQERFKKNPLGRIANIRFHLIRALFGHEGTIDFYAKRLCLRLAENEAELLCRRKWKLPALAAALSERRAIEAISSAPPSSSSLSKSL